MGNLADVATVLVVEDNTDLLEIYAEMLSMDSHTTRAVETAPEAIEALHRARPDVLVLDLTITGGFEPVLEVLRARPELAAVKVILVSGARDLAEQAATWGATYLRKPFMPEELLAAVACVLAPG